MKDIAGTLPEAHPHWGWPVVMAFIRLPLALAGSAIVILAYRLAGTPAGAAAGLGWSSLTLTIINLLCLALLLWRSKVEDWDIRETIGFRRRSLIRDILLGIGISLLLFGLLLLGVFGTLLLLHGRAAFTDLFAIFNGDADFAFSLPSWLALVSGIAFPLLNPIVEELQFRGYAQPRLAAAWRSAPAGIVVTALGFGLQHIVFTLTISGAIAYAAGFFLWGLGAGWFFHRQGRLVPLMVAHFISNLGGLVPLILMAQGVV
jgi:membrane protease YdiL (CAAX protease family)